MGFLPTSAQIYYGVNTSSYTKVSSFWKKIEKDSTKVREFSEWAKSTNASCARSFLINEKGVALRNKSNYEGALNAHQTAIQLASSCEDVLFKASALNMAGVVCRRTDKLRDATDYHKKALEILEKSNRQDESALRSIAVSKNSLGNIYLSMREYDLAEKEFTQSMTIEKRIGNFLGLAINNQNLGGIYEERKEYDKALNFFQTSLVYNNKIDSDFGRLICKNSIGRIYILQGKYAEAKKLVNETFSMATTLEDKFHAIATFTNLGAAETGLGEYQKAEGHLLYSLETAQKNNLPYFVAESYKWLAHLEEKRTNYQKALEYHQLFYENEQAYLKKEDQKYIANLVMQYDAEQKKDKIEILEKENELVKIKLTRNRLIFGGLLAVLGAVAVILYLRNRQNKLKSEKEILDLEQEMLRSQMNPHFLFNSLNSIKLYIINNEKDKAVFYLNKFSKLIRKILNASREKHLSLQDELETMELYINIENIRFSNKIDFHLEIEEGIKPSRINIPSMILQPFLENSIWHGLSSKEEDRKLYLRVKKKGNNHLEIEIEDNGVGRLKSEEIRTGKTLNKKSIGINLTEKRLRNFYKNEVDENTLKIIDLVDQNNHSLGTKVVLTLPATREAFSTELKENNNILT